MYMISADGYDDNDDDNNVRILMLDLLTPSRRHIVLLFDRPMEVIAGR